MPATSQAVARQARCYVSYFRKEVIAVALVDEYSVQRTTIQGVPVRCTIYKFGNTYHCVISSESSHAYVARSSGPTPDEALVAASEAARHQFLYG